MNVMRYEFRVVCRLNKQKLQINEIVLDCMYEVNIKYVYILYLLHQELLIITIMVPSKGK